MATYDASKATSGFDFTTFDLTGEVTPPPTGTTFRLTDKSDPDKDTYIQFDGVLFKDNGSNLTAGTIATITGVKNNSQLYQISTLAFQVDDKVADLLAKDDAQGFLAQVFSGADVLLGSNFNDHLIGYSGLDKLFGNAGNDTLQGGADEDFVDGGTGNDSLLGGTGDDQLFGGTGADTMNGGDGSDTYDFDNPDDVVNDTGLGVGDIDTIRSSLSYQLEDVIENLVLTGSATIGYGNASNNVLTGNGEDNTLDGKAGADIMKGGDGDDLYIVDDKGDVVDESGSGGFDTVESTASEFTLGVNVNNLTLKGDGNINGTGNDLGNTIQGNGGNNSLNGGAGHDGLGGGLGNDTIDGGTGNDKMAGGFGNDVYFVDSILDEVSDLAEKDSQDTVNVTGINYELGDELENLVLLGNLHLTGVGNSGKNHITGNAGNNLLAGDNVFSNAASGEDTLVGGEGNDTYLVWYATNQVKEDADEGYDIVKSVATFTLGDNIEELILTSTVEVDGTGNGLDNKITGNKRSNELSGLAGNDSINGGVENGNDTLDGGIGDDTMVGAAGDDLYVVDSLKDVVTDSSGTNDGVRVTGTNAGLVKLYTAIEHYDFSQFTGDPINFTGTAGANRIVGTAGNDTLAGGNGNDTLNGGAGMDDLNGGAGNDTYVMDNDLDQINDTGKDAGDTVQTAVLPVDLSIANFKGVENVTFTDLTDKIFNPLNAIGSDAKNILTGNSADNSLHGLAGNDTLIGGGGADVLEGGAGADSMAGGTGNDSYGVDSTGDKVVENASSGTDVVSSTISYVLGANVENLVLVGGNVNINGKGNDLGNVIVGNDGNNRIDGWFGIDIMEGKDGNDTYVVIEEEDQVVEDIGKGMDLVEAWVDIVQLYDNVENLLLKGIAGFEANGNKLANVITGNQGGNKIDGKEGADTMIGAAGDDIYTMDILGDKGDKIVENAGGGADEIIFDLDSNDASLLLTLRTNIEHYNFSKYDGDLVIDFKGDKAGNRITGSGKDDILAGDAGNDTLDGFFGADTLTGGAGNDSYVLDDEGDDFNEIVNGKDTGGKDTIVSLLGEYTLGDPDEGIENLTIGGLVGGNGTGNIAANVLTGNGGKNVLSGAEGNDTIIGSGGEPGLDGDDTLDGGLGNDSMVGGGGSDTYVIDSKSDRIVESTSPLFGLHDTVMVGNFSYVLARGLEDLVLTGTANINGTGNAGTNEITGNDGDNKLDGVVNKFGGDKLSGGDGDDTYYVHVATTTLTGIISDIVHEEANEGTDTVIADAKLGNLKSYTLGENVENLTLTGSLGSWGGGNTLDNTLIGNTGANKLQGGEGNDSLDGGSGNDTLLGDFDNDTLKGGVGNDELLGGSADDFLDGGTGADTMNGDLGSDTYVIDNAKDKIEDKGLDAEIDTIQASISIDLNLPDFNVIEGVRLTGAGALSATGDGGDNLLVGNTGANKLTGNDGDDTLDGGAGNDILTGGRGNDQIDVAVGNDVVHYTNVLDGNDVIDNFDGIATGGQDVLSLDLLFDSLSVTTAARAARVVLDDKGSSVEVHVDADGNGANGAELLVATLNTADDITVNADVLVGTL